MDFAIILKALVSFFVEMCSVELVFNDIEFTVGSVFIFVGLLGLFIWFIKVVYD